MTLRMANKSTRAQSVRPAVVRAKSTRVYSVLGSPLARPKAPPLTRCKSPCMKYVQLGSSDLMVSELCLGTATFGRQNSEEEAFELLDCALENGVNFFDSAELYPIPSIHAISGATEKIIGKWMKSRNCREKITLATKVLGGYRSFGTDEHTSVVANRHDPPLQNAPRNVVNRKNILEAVEGSLRRLQTTYIDLYQIHWPDRYVPIFGSEAYIQENESSYTSFEEQIQTMADLIQEGKIRHWGISNETSFGVMKFCSTAKNMGLPPPVSIQNGFSLTNRKFQSELAETCSAANCNVGLMAFGALAGGTHTGKYMHGNKPEGARHTIFPDFIPRYTRPGTLAAAAKYAKLAESKGLTAAQLALSFCRHQFFVAASVVGVTSVEQLKENIHAFTDVDLDEDTLMEIDKIHAEDRNPAWS